MTNPISSSGNPVLVTGAAGFIGYHLAKRLLDDDHKVIGVDNLSFTRHDAQRDFAPVFAEPVTEPTIVLFTSDHGYHMGEHGHWQKRTLFENATRVPLIISGPGITNRGQSCDGPVEMVDFYPTLAALCELRMPPYVQGVSLVPALEDPDARPRPAALSQCATGYSLRTERYRYTEWGEDGEAGAELYDHQTDPQELVNLAEDSRQANRIEALSEQLRQRIKQARTQPEGVKQIQFENRRWVR